MQLNAVFSDIEFRRWSRIVALTWLEFLEASVSALTIVSSLIITFTSNTSWKGLLWHDGSALDRYEDFVATKLGNVNSACFHETAFQRPFRKICVEWLYFRDSETREITFPVENQSSSKLSSHWLLFPHFRALMWHLFRPEICPSIASQLPYFSLPNFVFPPAKK